MSQSNKDFFQISGSKTFLGEENLKNSFREATIGHLKAMGCVSPKLRLCGLFSPRDVYIR